MRAFVLSLVACLLLAAPCALAEEAGPLERLKPEERAVLERRIPGLATLPADKQEQIVRNVERLRKLDPAQRELVERRLRAAREAGLEPRELGEREQAWRGLGERRVQAEWQMRVLKALGWRAWNDLPADLRAHPAVAPLLHREWPQAFHQRFVKRAAQAWSEEQVRAWQPPPSLPEAWRRDFDKDRARLLASADPAKGLAELRKRVLLGRAMAVVQEALSEAPAGEGSHAARFTQLGERLRALAEPAYVETITEFQRLAATKGPEGFAALVREQVAPPRPPPEMQRRIESFQLVLALEAWTPVLARRPELGAAADVLLRAALVDELGMPAQDFERLPPRGEGAEARAKALRAWMDESLPRELRRALLQRRWGGGERGGWAPGGGWRRGPGGDERGRDEKGR